MDKNNWTYKKLGECLSYIKNGANIKQTKGAEGIPITRIETLSGGVFNRDRLGYADIFTTEKFSQYIMDDGDILMSHINSKAYIGRAVLYRKECNEQIIHGMNLLRLKVIPSLVHSSYLNLLFKSYYFRDRVAKIRKDAVNQSSMAISDLVKIPIPIPPLAEQERIVAELDLLTSIIEKKKAQLKELDQLAQSIFYDMFGDPITNEKGWEVKKLGEVTTQITDGSHNPPKGLDYSEYPMLSSKNIFFGYYNYDSPRYLSKEDFEIENKRTNISNGDVLLTIVGTVGRTCCIKSPFIPFTLQRSVAVLKPKHEVLLSVHLMFFLNSLSDLWDREAKGVAQKGIYLKQLAMVPVALPPLPLQQEFADKVEAIERQKSLIQQSIVETQTLFDSRMDYWFG